MKEIYTIIKIPDTREAVAQYLELYMMSGDPDDFEKIVDFDYQNAQMIVRINDASTPVLAAIKDKIESYKQQRCFYWQNGWLRTSRYGTGQCNDQRTKLCP